MILNRTTAKILTSALLMLSLTACFKSVSVKEDANNYGQQEQAMMPEFTSKQTALMQKAQTLQAHPENIDGFVTESNALFSDMEAKLTALKPQTEPVKKFQALEIKAISDMKVQMTTLGEGMKNKDVAKVQEVMKNVNKNMMDLQTAKTALIAEANK